MAFGLNIYGQCNVPALPPGLYYVEIVAGGIHNLARRSDGAVLAWGYGQSSFETVPALPPGHTYIAIAAGGNHSAALVAPIGPTNYCLAKTTSSGCVPTIAFSGIPSVTGDYTVSCSLVEPGVFGLLFYGTSGPAAYPFQDGLLCVQPPLARMTVQNSGGSAACSGLYSQTLSELIATLPIAQTVNCQYWFRDAGAASTTGLSNANRFVTE